MKKQELIDALHANHKIFLSTLKTLTEEELTTAPEGKWTALQQLDHLRITLDAVNLVFKLPFFLSKWYFGKSNRPSRTYQEFITKYQAKAAVNTAPALEKYAPKVPTMKDYPKLVAKLNQSVETMAKGIENKTEAQFEELMLPHPLVGRGTFREMLYFSVYHALHHENLVKQYLGKI
jgi:hypothetical protein